MRPSLRGDVVSAVLLATRPCTYVQSGLATSCEISSIQSNLAPHREIVTASQLASPQFLVSQNELSTSLTGRFVDFPIAYSQRACVAMASQALDRFHRHNNNHST